MRLTAALYVLGVLVMLPASSSASLPDDVFKDAFELPLSAPANTWTWEPFPDAFCGDGSTVGIGINPSSTGNRVLIYLEGGGACYNEQTCYTFGTAANFGGYAETQFVSESTGSGYLAMAHGFFDRTEPSNPFKDYSYVYVPYCTGDSHAGNNVLPLGTHTAHFVGFSNMKAYLNRLYPTFRAADRIVLAGSSAGGFGAAANWWQTQRAFGNVRVDMIDDSGTFMPPDILAVGNGSDVTESAAWSLATTLPPPCTTCTTAIDTIFDFYAAQFPNSRGALLSYRQDSVLPSFYGINATQFTTGLHEVESSQFTTAAAPSLAYFEVGGSGHVLWFSPALAAGNTTTGTFTLQQFLSLMESDDPSWKSLGP